jgi:hypothetical protein
MTIVEFIMYGTNKYFRDRFQAIRSSLNDNFLFGSVVTNYMMNKAIKAKLHQVVPCGIRKKKFWVYYKYRACRGLGHETVVEECVLKNDDPCICSCLKPKLLHMPCSHVMAGCAECGISLEIYVLDYFENESIACTWQYEVQGYHIIGPITKQAPHVVYIPNPRTKRVRSGHHKTRRIHNDLD